MHHLFTAFRFHDPVDGRIKYDMLIVPAQTHDEARSILDADGVLRGEMYLQTDASIEAAHAHNCGRSMMVSSLSFDSPTVEDHERWVRIQCRARYDDDFEYQPASYTRIN